MRRTVSVTMARKIIQMVSHALPAEGMLADRTVLLGLADDGTVWRMSEDKDGFRSWELFIDDEEPLTNSERAEDYEAS